MVWDLADGNKDLEQWLDEVDRFCVRFLDLEFVDLIQTDAGLEPVEEYYRGARPADFFCNAVLPYLEYEYGAEWVEEWIGEHLMWGNAPS